MNDRCSELVTISSSHYTAELVCISQSSYWKCS